MKNIIVLLITLASSVVFALKGGDHAGNGGDMCENRFLIVRDDITDWILKGGSAGLNLPIETSAAFYKTQMLDSIRKAKVSCSEDKIFIGNAEKTCMNVFTDDGIPQINCNIQRFMETSQSDQYVLVHHEYAGLAGFEVNNQEASNYNISNQISGYLEDQVVKKLVIKPAPTAASNEVKILSQLFQQDASSYYLLKGSNQSEKDCSVLIKKNQLGNYYMDSTDGQFMEIKKDSYMINSAVSYGRYVPTQDTILVNTNNLLNIAMNPPFRRRRQICWPSNRESDWIGYFGRYSSKKRTYFYLHF